MSTTCLTHNLAAHSFLRDNKIAHQQPTSKDASESCARRHLWSQGVKITFLDSGNHFAYVAPRPTRRQDAKNQFSYLSTRRSAPQTEFRDRRQNRVCPGEHVVRARHHFVTDSNSDDTRQVWPSCASGSKAVGIDPFSQLRCLFVARQRVVAVATPAQRSEAEQRDSPLQQEFRD